MHDQAAEHTPEFEVVAEPGATSTIAISTALADDEALAATVLAQPAPSMSSDDLDRPSSSVEPESLSEPVAQTAEQPIFSPVLPDPEQAATAPEPSVVAEPASLITEPAAEAAAAPDVPQPPPSQSAQTIGHSFTKTQKDIIMDMTTNFGSGLNDVMSGAQDKAKEALEKGSSMMGEVGSFARGNVEAVVESGKILAAGLQDMSTNLVAEGRTSFETMTADLKELAGSKTPADFFKAQSEIMRKSMDSVVALGSKNSEAMLKLASDVLAPLSGRMNVAVEKVKMPMA